MLGGLRKRRLGYVEDVPDPRDIGFDALGLGATTRPVSLRQYGPDVRHQANTSSCVGQSVAEGCEMCRSAHAGHYTEPLSALWPYWLGRRYAMDRMVDLGCQIRNAIKGVVRAGFALEEAMPWDPRRVNAHPDGLAIQSAHDNRGPRGYYRIDTLDIDRRLEQIGAALNRGLPVVFGTWVDRQFLANGGPVVVGPPQNKHGRHAMLCVGIGSDGSLEVKNSWGAWWRDGGHVRMTPECVAWWRDIWVIDVIGRPEIHA